MTVESVWDYPRPPRLEASSQRIRVVHGGATCADTTNSFRVLETSHPPVYYVPPGSVLQAVLRPSTSRRSFCEFKGMASYWDLVQGGVTVRDVAWSYQQPTAHYSPIAGFFAFYASKVDECWVGDERVMPQAGDFYGGWITANLRGPFKGAPGTLGW